MVTALLALLTTILTAMFTGALAIVGVILLAVALVLAAGLSPWRR